jgi:hypothetical protein
VDIQRWFAIESPKEMSEDFTLLSAIYYIAEAGGPGTGLASVIERHVDEICDPSEWFASCMYLETVRRNQQHAVRWTLRNQSS